MFLRGSVLYLTFLRPGLLLSAYKVRGPKYLGYFGQSRGLKLDDMKLNLNFPKKLILKSKGSKILGYRFIKNKEK